MLFLFRVNWCDCLQINNLDGAAFGCGFGTRRPDNQRIRSGEYTQQGAVLTLVRGHSCPLAVGTQIVFTRPVWRHGFAKRGAFARRRHRGKPQHFPKCRQDKDMTANH